MSASPNQARDVFVAAVKLAPELWDAYLAEACTGDEALRARVRDLLAAHQAAGSFLQPAVASLAVTSDEPLSERPGAVIGPYRLLEQVGEGGFGVVFVAEQQQPVRRKLALKVLKPGMDTKQVVARFEAERQALALMDHPNIAKVFDGGETASGRPYFVMELVRGVPITEFCDQNHLAPRQRLELFLSVCQAVQHAHQKGVIHRDLKPSNVLVSRHDATPVVKVIDFGVAKALGQELTDKTLFTGVAQMLGTPLYMSPEQAGMSDLDVDTRSDIYSLGVLLYELLTGTTPFTKERFKKAAYDEIRRIIREEEPPKPSTRLSESKDGLPSTSAQRQTEQAELARQVRGELDWIVMKALEKDRARRYETANGFAADVLRYLADEPVLACPPSAGYRLRKFARRNKVGLTTAGIVALSLVIGIAVSSWLAVRASDAEGLAETRLEAEKREHAKAVEEEEKATRAAEQLRVEKRQTQVSLSTFLLQKGLEFCERGEVEVGILWLARSLEHAPDDAADLQRVIRANLAGWGNPICPLKVEFPLFGPRRGIPDATSVAFSPDGKTLLTFNWTGKEGNRYVGEVRRWEAATGKSIGTPLPHGCGFHHSSGVVSQFWAATFSPDGRVVVTGVDDTTAQLWDLATGLPIGPPLQHPRSVRAVAFSADGRTLMTRTGVRLYGSLPPGVKEVRESQGIQLWEAATGKPIGKPIEPPGRDWAVTISPDGGTILTVSPSVPKDRIYTARPDGSINQIDQGPDIPAESLLWKASTGERLRPLLENPKWCRGALFTPDGRCVLLGVPTDQPGSEGQAWEVETGRRTPLFLPHEFSITNAVPSPDGKFLVNLAGQAGGQVHTRKNPAKLWRLPFGYRDTLELIVSWKNGVPLAHPGEVTAAAFSPDGQLVLTGSLDGTARLWRTATGDPLGPPLPHPNAVSSVAFSPDGRTFLTCDGTARLWLVASGKPTPRWSTDTVCNTVAKLPRGHRGSNATGSWLPLNALQHRVGARLMDPYRRFHLDDSTDGEFLSLAFGGDGKTVLTAFLISRPFGQDFLLAQAQDAATSTPLDGLLEVPNGRTAAFSPDGKSLVTVAAEWKTVREASVGGKATIRWVVDQERIRSWEPGTWKPIGPPGKFPGVGAGNMALSRDGGIAFLTRWDATKLWWDAPLEDGRALWDRARFEQLWDTREGKPLGPPLAGRITALALSPDGTVLLTADGAEARLRAPDTGKPLGPPLPHQGEVVVGAFSPDGRAVLTGSRDKATRLWDAVTGKLLARPMHHPGEVTALAFSPDARTVLSASKDGTARFWDAETGFPLGPPLIHLPSDTDLVENFIKRVAFSPDGRRAITATNQGHLRCWEAPAVPLQGPTGQLALWARVITPRELDADGVVGWQASATRDERLRRLKDSGGVPAPAEDVLAWHRHQARVCRQDGHWFAARWHLDRLVAAEPNQGTHYRDRGQACAGLGEHEQAKADVSRAIALGVSASDAWNGLGRVYAEARYWDQAQDAFEKAIRFEPTLAEAHHGLGLALQRQAMPGKGSLESAIEAYREAIRLKPDYDEARADLVAALQSLLLRLVNPSDAKGRDPAETVLLARELLQRSLPRDFRIAYRLLGVAEYRAGNWKQAVEALNKCGEPLVVNDQFLLAMAHWRLGDKESARRCYDRAVQRMKGKDPGTDTELGRLREEAAALLGMQDKKD